MTLEAEKPSNHADQAYQALRGMILRQELPPFERITELRAAEILQLSRTPVREAIKRLTVEGFLLREPGKGLRVAGLSDDEQTQIFELRLMLETYAVRRVAERATPEEVEALRALALETERLSPPKSDAEMEGLSKANDAFHQMLMQLAHSKRLSSLMRSTLDMALVQRTFRAYRPEEIRRSARHHLEIVEAVAAGNPDWAANVMAAHLQAAQAVAARRDDI